MVSARMDKRAFTPLIMVAHTADKRSDEIVMSEEGEMRTANLQLKIMKYITEAMQTLS